MKVISFKTDNTIRKDIEPLFTSAFPKEERPEADYYFASFNKPINELYGFYDNDEFVGFTSVTLYKDICYIFFLAVQDDKRGQGYGSQILNELKRIYAQYVLLLCYELVDPSYKDYEYRKKREQFYLHNGFRKNPLITNEFGVIFQTAVIGDRDVTIEEYKQIFKNGFGEFALDYLSEVK